MYQYWTDKQRDSSSDVVIKMLEIYSKKNQEKKAVLSKNRIHTFILGHSPPDLKFGWPLFRQITPWNIFPSPTFRSNHPFMQYFTASPLIRPFLLPSFSLPSENPIGIWWVLQIQNIKPYNERSKCTSQWIFIQCEIIRN